MRGEPPDLAVPNALCAVRDGLRARLSLAQAIVRAAAMDHSPLAPVAAGFAPGRPLADVLEEAGARAVSPELSFSLVVLSVQARTGGDPAPAVAALEARVRKRVASAREVRTLTTQARMSARAMLLLTPGFLILLAVLDPRGTWASLTGPGGRLALEAALVLQVLGGLWMSRIVSRPLAGPGRSPRASAGKRRAMARLPVVRAAVVLARGGGERRRSGAVLEEVAHAAEVVALALEAGLSPSRALELAAPGTPGAFGRALRDAVAAIRAGAGRAAALQAAVGGLDVSEARRFVDALASADSLGVPVARSLRSLADEIRDARAAAVSEEVHRASLKALVPLGALILPAFVLACLVPLFLNGLRGISL